MRTIRLLFVALVALPSGGCLEGDSGLPHGYRPVGADCVQSYYFACREGSSCEYGACRWLCDSDSDCPSGAGCVAVPHPDNDGYLWDTRVCLLDEELGCTVASDSCPELLYCHQPSGVCREGCRDELPCPSGFDCEAQLCVPAGGD